MKKIFFSVFKILIPLAFGGYLIYKDLSQLTTSEKNDLMHGILSANIPWLILSLVIGMLSHVSRAYRWNYLTQPLGIKITFWNSFFSIMIGYAANLVFPRVGEIIRCSMITKYEKHALSKLIGTVVIERIFDLMILCIIILLVFFTQFNLLHEYIHPKMELFLNSNNLSQKLMYVSIAIGTFMVVAYVIFKKVNHPLIDKLGQMVKQMYAGLKNILHMKQKTPFLIHTLFIWFAYILSMYFAFISLDIFKNITIDMLLTCFLVGSLSVILVQGGIGIYPIAIMQALALYSIPEENGRTVGWLIWSVQTGLIIFAGIISWVFITYYNRKKNHSI